MCDVENYTNFFYTYDDNTCIYAHTNKKYVKHIKILHKRHETPVLNHPIKIIYVDNDLVVLDKPCSLPVSKIKIK